MSMVLMFLILVVVIILALALWKYFEIPQFTKMTKTEQETSMITQMNASFKTAIDRAVNIRKQIKTLDRMSLTRLSNMASSARKDMWDSYHELQESISEIGLWSRWHTWSGIREWTDLNQPEDIYNGLMETRDQCCAWISTLSREPEPPEMTEQESIDEHSENESEPDEQKEESEQEAKQEEKQEETQEETQQEQEEQVIEQKENDKELEPESESDSEPLIRQRAKKQKTKRLKRNVRKRISRK